MSRYRHLPFRFPLGLTEVFGKEYVWIFTSLENRGRVKEVKFYMGRKGLPGEIVFDYDTKSMEVVEAMSQAFPTTGTWFEEGLYSIRCRVDEHVLRRANKLLKVMWKL